MSGGSFNSLYANDFPVERLQDYREMRDALVSYGQAGTRAREDFALLIACLNMATGLHSRLRGVMHAVEWHHSGDYLEDQVREEMVKYAKEHPSG